MEIRIEIANQINEKIEQFERFRGNGYEITSFVDNGRTFFEIKKYGFTIQIAFIMNNVMRVVSLDDTERIIKENERAIELFKKRDLSINELNELKNMKGVFLIAECGRVKSHDNKMLYDIFIWDKVYKIYC